MRDSIAENKATFYNLHKKVYLFLRETMSLKALHNLSITLKQENREFSLSDNQNRLFSSLKTAVIAFEEIGLKQPTVCSILLINAIESNSVSLKQVEHYFGEEIKVILEGLVKVHEFERKKSDDKSDNYVKLLLSFIKDIRVIFIVLAVRLQQMRDAKEIDEKQRFDIGVETLFLYAPLAHRLGLYNIKSELEDLSLKYTDREAFDYVARKLNETKRSRDQYIDEFIKPVREKL